MNDERSEITTTVQLPAEAKLVWQTETGSAQVATRESLAQVGFVDRRQAYDRFTTQLRRGLGLTPEVRDDFKGVWNTVRYIVECALFYDHDFDHGYVESGAPDDDEDNQDSRRMYAQLRAVPAGEDD